MTTAQFNWLRHKSQRRGQPVICACHLSWFCSWASPQAFGEWNLVLSWCGFQAESCCLHRASVGFGLQLLLFLFRLEQGDKHTNRPFCSPTLGMDFGQIFKKNQNIFCFRFSLIAKPIILFFITQGACAPWQECRAPPPPPSTGSTEHGEWRFKTSSLNRTTLLLQSEALQPLQADPGDPSRANHLNSAKIRPLILGICSQPQEFHQFSCYRFDFLQKIAPLGQMIHHPPTVDSHRQTC